ncbi:hypothetical protein METBIDRAFT_32538 [Metschnikowia bicuspidata var. bicuspidata NRRL YB-4993]|uniref:chitin synthase n=1 Tax=Metschnikowia bicuspidata var. bicuspidata NRRL YB-4993 TaxID=869754 RepID=A0A1A0H982_9ASCO|nr:hypothetical protein METBIDRAFT_32538 [Metschnikowia bicuspidata var. bicuspidata NRRL YB-4993]OBA20555.1 hypothetical protein METBIDRAFT_32538 [Metschnikowia bicuspidata var. bicuspidata NRRL YB-4993]
MTYSSDDSDPFRDHPDPSAPLAAFTSDRTSPRRLYQLNTEVAHSDDDSEFVGIPSSLLGNPNQRRSPNIFTRSSMYAQPNVNSLLSLSVPPLTPETARTPRANYTLQESPKRKKQAGYNLSRISSIRNKEDDVSPVQNFQSPDRLSKSERILEPPEPIFTPEALAEAKTLSSEVFDDQTLHLSANSEYAYQIYQKEYDDKQSFSDVNTAVTSESYQTSNQESDYFGASLDKDMMQNITKDYVPNKEKTFMKRKVRLVDGKSGNLVLENRIPEELQKVLTRTDSPFGEFTNMTYTACTAEPDNFVQEGFTLRAAKYGRETEIVVCVTMYNEDETSFARTMHGIMKNVAHLCSRSKSSIWGRDSWKKVQVIIVADGRNKINESVLQLLTATGCYQDNLARPYVNNRKVNAHLFEYTTQISIDENLKFKGDEKSLTPVQVLFCLKEQNQKKINSHRWLFNAFCPILDPNVVVLLDVGTKPDNHAIYNMWKAFDQDSNVAGVAGEITAMKGKGWINLLNPLVASQNFEYKMSNILDKPLESVFGYISVLPGALSAYRYIALKNHEDGTGPLHAYFKGEDLLTSHHERNSKTNFFEANMYLAEDRILCWELVAKRNENWVLKFVKQATGETDVPDTVPEFLLQRRRWMNGAFFAALYSLRHANRIWQTDHSFTRKFWFCFEFAYQLLTLTFSFFSLSNFYLTFYFLTGSLILEDSLGNGGFWIFTIFNYICICVLTSMFVASIGNRPQASKNIFKVLMILLTICALYALIVGLYFVITTIQKFGTGETSSSVFVSIVVSLLATYGLYTLTSILYLDPWHMVTCSLQYFLLIPSYTCTLQIFAFCNTHDVSWGTKGDSDPREDKTNQYIIQKNDEGEFEAVILDYNIDEVYLETLYNIRAKRSSQKVKSNKNQAKTIDGEDYAKNVRTKVVLIWLLANLIFIMTMLQVYEPGETSQNYYLVFILWFVAFFAFIRATGSIAYLIQNLARRMVQANSKWSHNKMGYSHAGTKSLN